MSGQPCTHLGQTVDAGCPERHLAALSQQLEQNLDGRAGTGAAPGGHLPSLQLKTRRDRRVRILSRYPQPSADTHREMGGSESEPHTVSTNMCLVEL